MPKVHPNLQEPNQKILTITSLPAKEFVTLRNYLHQQILLFCEPLIMSNKLLLKQYPNTFDKTFTREEEINVLVERRKSLISAILDAKKRKCEMLTRLLEMRISEENLADQETMLLKFRVKEVKAKIIKLSIHKSIENEGSHTVAAYQEVEKHLNKLLSSRGLTA
uniref:Uncharacterized protein n=1 Tax=Lutzomyia longipalpis TaxID=7200 RepID=A0A1B0GJ57_LUTLO